MELMDLPVTGYEAFSRQPMARWPQVLLFCVSQMVLGAAIASGAAIDLQFVSIVPAPNNNEVKLNKISIQIAAETVDVSNSLAVAYLDKYSVVLVSVDHRSNQRYFTYRFAAWKNDAPADKTIVLVNVVTTGSFADFSKETEFDLVDGSTSVHGKIQLPFHPRDPMDVCKVIRGDVDLPTDKSPLSVFLGVQQHYTVRLDCTESQYPPDVLSITGPRMLNDDYWSAVSYESAYFGPKITSHQLTTRTFDLLTVKMTPSILNALASRFRRVTVGDAPDDTIFLDVTYAVQAGGIETPLTLKLPVTFFPSPEVIGFALVVGVAVGWATVCLLLAATGQGRTIKRWSSLGVSLLVTVVAFVFSLAAFSAKCRIQLFDLQLTPFDVVQLGILGFVCACICTLRTDGVLQFLKGLIDRIRFKQPTAVALIVAALFLGCSEYANAGDNSARLVGLASCDDGDVLGLANDGRVFLFSSSAMSSGRWIGTVNRSLVVAEVTCGEFEGQKTAFIVANSTIGASVIRMDVATGAWKSAILQVGSTSEAGSIAYDRDNRQLFITSLRSRSIFRMTTDFNERKEWATLFDNSESIGAIAVDHVGKRLLVGEGFSGSLRSITLSDRRQKSVTMGVGSANSIAIDPRHHVVYVADDLQRAVWTLSTDAASPTPRRFIDLNRLRSVVGFDLKRLSGVAIDGQANLWVGVFDPGVVLIFAPDGKFLKAIH